ncbi:21846_t:CDS:1, partial [Racocetra persica]
DKNFEINIKKMKEFAKYNSKRKYKVTDLIEIMMNLTKFEGVKNEM